MADAAPADLFKQRKRPRRKGNRKRARHRAADLAADGCEDAPAQKRADTRSDRAENGAENDAWQREQFSAKTENNAEAAKRAAVAERGDVGGSGAASAKPFGPLSAPTHLRTSVRVDYQPDVCKDYKETGYCGFGDSCKFLHDRSDYKSGWQLDKDWAERQRERRDRMLRGQDPDKEAESPKPQVDDGGLPFACHICRAPFKSPVETLCLHYFCEKCALKRMSTHGTCAICETPLRGTLNVAHKLAARVRRK